MYKQERSACRTASSIVPLKTTQTSKGKKTVLRTYGDVFVKVWVLLNFSDWVRTWHCFRLTLPSNDNTSWHKHYSCAPNDTDYTVYVLMVLFVEVPHILCGNCLKSKHLLHYQHAVILIYWLMLAYNVTPNCIRSFYHHHHHHHHSAKRSHCYFRIIYFLTFCAHLINFKSHIALPYNWLYWPSQISLTYCTIWLAHKWRGK